MPSNGQNYLNGAPNGTMGANTIPPSRFGGNVDDWRIGPGATMYYSKRFPWSPSLAGSRVRIWSPSRALERSSSPWSWVLLLAFVELCKGCKHGCAYWAASRTHHLKPAIKHSFHLLCSLSASSIFLKVVHILLPWVHRNATCSFCSNRGARCQIRDC